MITFAGGTFCLEDDEGQFARWLEENLSIQDLRAFSWLPVSQVHQFTSKDYGGIPVMNWAHGPTRPKLNTLYWPTGASRWACGLFLANTTEKNKMLAAVGTTNERKTLYIGDDFDQNSSTAGAGIAVQMHMLPPRPIVHRALVERSADSTSPVESGAEGLWLIPLVDGRYYWQWKDTGDLDAEGDTWTELFDKLETALGITLTTDTIASTYLCPNIYSLRRKYDNAALLLDALAHSVGMRLVFAWDADSGNDALEADPDKYELVGYANTSTRDLNARKNTYGKSAFPNLIVAGDKFDGQNTAATCPESVIITFPKRVEGTPVPNEYYEIEITAAANLAQSTPGTRKIFRDSAYANFTFSGVSPTNLSALTALAQRIAGDYYTSVESWHDRTFVGIQLIKDTPWMDYAEYSYRGLTPDKAHTREHGNTYNLGMEDLWHGGCGDTIVGVDRWEKACMIETLKEGDELASAWIMDGSCGTWARTEEEIQVCGDSGLRGVVFGTDDYEYVDGPVAGDETLAGEVRDESNGTPVDVYYSAKRNTWSAIGGYTHVTGAFIIVGETPSSSDYALVRIGKIFGDYQYGLPCVKIPRAMIECVSGITENTPVTLHWDNNIHKWIATETCGLTDPPEDVHCCDIMPASIDFMVVGVLACDFDSEVVTLVRSGNVWTWTGTLGCGDEMTIELTCHPEVENDEGCNALSLRYVYPCAEFDEAVTISDCDCETGFFNGEVEDFGDVDACECCQEPVPCEANDCGTGVRRWNAGLATWQVFSSACTSPCTTPCIPERPGAFDGEMYTVGCCNNAGGKPCNGF